MMLYKNGKSSNLIVILLLFILVVYLIPVLIKAKNVSFLSNFFDSSDKFNTVLLRSVLFAILNSLICILLSLWFAFKIIKIDFSGIGGKILSILVVPFLLGSTSIAFVFKMLLLNSDLMGWAYEKPLNLFFILTIIQFWQFGSLFTYLFWLSLKSINTYINQYAISTKLSKWEYFKDICIPNLKGLIFLLSIICFIFSFYEDVKISLIFRASEGLNTELISHWLYRYYQSNILIGYNFAIKKIVFVSQDTLFGIGIVFVLLGASFLLIKSIYKSQIIHISFYNSKIWKNNSVKLSSTSIVLIGLIAFPLIAIFCVNKMNFERFSFSTLPFRLSILGALLATNVAVLFSFFSRLINYEKMGSFNLFSIKYLAWLYIILLIPPLVIMLGGFEWMNLLDLHGYIGSVVFWLLGHTILSLPILGSFLMVTNFKITSNELNYCRVYRVSQKDLFIINFLKRFKADYLLTFLFAYTLILNEGLLNKVFSDNIPSFVSALNESISSKNADYTLSTLFFLVSLIVAIACVGIWIYSINKNQNEKNRT